MTIGSDTGFTT